jgi:hypothetical protein
MTPHQQIVLLNVDGEVSTGTMKFATQEDMMEWMKNNGR